MATRIQLRRDNSANWASNNPVLESGEVAISTDLEKIKIGNGSSTWSQLGYINLTPTEIQTQIDLAISNLIDSSPALLNTLNEIAAAINDDPTFFTTVATNLSNHEADTTSIHGISNTANLVYTNDARLTDSRTPTDNSVTSAKIANGAILDEDINASAAISPSKISGTAVVTNDARLSDSRTPTAHAASHGSGQSDPLTLSQSQITNLTTDLSAKSPLASPTFTGVPLGPTAAIDTDTTQLATTEYVINQDYIKTYTASSTYAPLASPTLTGVPAAPTAELGTNTTQIATTAFVKAETAALVDAAPATLDTLNELAAALGDDANFATTISTSLGQKAPIDSPTLTGTPAAPTAAVDTNTTQVATTAYVVGQGYLKSATASSTYAPLASPTLTGTPAAPTAAVDTDTTQVATTAYVVAQGYLKSATASSTYAPLASPTLTGTPAAPTAAYDDSSTKIATTEYVQNAIERLTVNTKTDSYTISLADSGEVIEMNSASANTLTIPANSTVEFPIGTKIDIIQYGSGQTTIDPAVGVTLRSKEGKLKLNTQYSGLSMYKRDVNEWIIVGDLTS